jgi:DNA-binding MarR family transcriptional regulator
MNLQSARTLLLVRLLQIKEANSMAAALAGCDLTPAQFQVLSVMSHRATWSTATMARRLLVSPQSMNETMAALEKKRLITRQESKDDRRTLNIHLTALGTRVLEKADREIDRVEQQLFGAFSPAELLVFRSCLINAINSAEPSEDRETMAARASAGK